MNSKAAGRWSGAIGLRWAVAFGGVALSAAVFLVLAATGVFTQLIPGVIGLSLGAIGAFVVLARQRMWRRRLKGAAAGVRSVTPLLVALGPELTPVHPSLRRTPYPLEGGRDVLAMVSTDRALEIWGFVGRTPQLIQNIARADARIAPIGDSGGRAPTIRIEWADHMVPVIPLAAEGIVRRRLRPELWPPWTRAQG
jgi:hypothetical protein